MPSSNSLAANDRQRLIHLCGMTDSNHDGEALNAIRLANRTLRAVKATWADAIELHPAPPPWQHQIYEYIPRNWPTRWRWVACACFESGRYLSPYETDLIRKIIVYRRYAPLPEDMAWLQSIAERVLTKAKAAPT